MVCNLFKKAPVIATVILGIIFYVASTTSAPAAENNPEIPFHDQWAASAHADAKAGAFRHWDKDGKVPKDCATCHSSDGYKDFIGADGSAKGVVDSPASTTTVVTCTTCHNPASIGLDTVTFPSGVSVKGGSSTRCMVCHQGRQSGADVDAAIDGMSADAVSDKLKFLNVHYAAAAATLWGGKAKAGYEYSGIDYQGPMAHTENLNECAECHEPHSLEVRVETCASCHTTVTDAKSVRTIRWSKPDFDGDGNTDEGISDEISTLHEHLLATMQAYAKKMTKPIVYDAHAYPYFFVDTNGNGKADKKEAIFPNQYKAWTPRLLKASYNYQFVAKDNGAYSHNPRYVMQLLFDSISDLSSATETDTKGMIRP